MAAPLTPYVESFVDDVSSALGELSGRDHAADCTIEARNIVTAVLAADGRFTTDELEGWLTAIGARLDPPVLVTAHQLRASDLLRSDDGWLASPSTLFDLLVRADARDGTARATVYYGRALELAHAAAALDLVPSPDEIAAIDRFRATLLAGFDAAAVARPGAGASTGGPATAATPPSPSPEPVPARPVDEVLAELDELIGLDQVKGEVRRLTSLIRVQTLRADHGLPVIETSRHIVFVGNPGTGKTTVARLLSEVYRSLDVLSEGHLVETDRSSLVAGYVGQTATKTRAVLESALGGTVLIDEAYALARGGENDFGREAIDTLVKFMEDHRDDLAVIVAGYPDEMQELIDTNPGLDSRFARTLAFPDYTTDELVAIFGLIARRQEYHLDADAARRLHEVIAAEPRDRGFGNARFVRNVFEQAVALHAVRLADVDAPTRDDLTTLTPDDIAAV